MSDQTPAQTKDYGPKLHRNLYNPKLEKVSCDESDMLYKDPQSTLQEMPPTGTNRVAVEKTAQVIPLASATGYRSSQSQQIMERGKEKSSK